MCLNELIVHVAPDGSPWWSLREVADMLQVNTSDLSATAPVTRRRKIQVGKFPNQRTRHLIDGDALIACCAEYGMMPNAEVRAYVQGQSGA